MRSFLLSLDIYGAKPSLFVSGETEHRTLLGSIVTIFTVLLSLGACLMFGQDFFKLNPSVVTEEKVQDEPLVIFPTSDTFTVFFEVITGDGEPLRPADLKTKFATSFIYLKKNQDNDYEMQLSDLSDPKPCSETKAVDNPDLESINLENAFCLDWEALSAKLGRPVPLGGFLGDDEVSLFRIEVRNSSASNEKSLYNEIKKEILGGIAVKVTYPSFIFDINSPNDPIKKTTQSFLYNLNANMQRVDRHFFEAATLEDDIGWIFEDIRLYQAIKQDSYQTEISVLTQAEADNSIIEFYSFLGYLSKKNLIFRRKYMKIQEVAALAGGFIKILHLSCTLFMGLYSELQMNNVLIAFEQGKQGKIENVSFTKSPAVNRSEASIRPKHKITHKPLSFSSFFCGRLKIKKSELYLDYLAKETRLSAKFDIKFFIHFFSSLETFLINNNKNALERAEIQELKQIFNYLPN